MATMIETLLAAMLILIVAAALFWYLSPRQQEIALRACAIGCGALIMVMVLGLLLIWYVIANMKMSD
jgi:hypothetical protein